MGLEMWSWRELRWLSWMGYWPYTYKTQKAQRISKIVGNCFLATLICIFVPEVVNVVMLFASGSVVDGILSMVTAMMGVECLSKIVIFFYHRKRIKRITEKIDDLERRARAVLEPEEIAPLYQPNYLLCHLTLYYEVVAWAATLQWLLTPTINKIIGQREFLLESMYPWRIDTFENWLMSYCGLIIHVTTAITALCIIDSLCWIMLVLIHGQMDYLKVALRRLDFRPPGADSHGKVTLKFCVEFYQDVLEVCDELNAFMGLPILMHVLMATLVICLSIFLFTSAKEQDLRTMNMLELAGCQVFEMYVFNWLCQRIENQDEKLIRAAYSSNWHEGCTADRRSYFILTEMCKKRRSFGLLVKANFQTFIGVMQSAFSYYNFLAAVSEENS